MFGHGDHDPETLVGVSFDDEFRAKEFLTAVTGLAAHLHLVLKDAVTVIKHHDGKTVVHETIDPQPLSAGFSGAVWAGLFGLILGGPVGWVAGITLGASAGVVAARVVDLGISDDWIAWFRDAVQPGTTTVVILAAQLDRAALIAEAKRFTGAQLVYANLDADAVHKFKHALGDTTISPTIPADSAS